MIKPIKETPANRIYTDRFGRRWKILRRMVLPPSSAQPFVLDSEHCRSVAEVFRHLQSYDGRGIMPPGHGFFGVTRWAVSRLLD
jgi:hypothetical protein